MKKYFFTGLVFLLPILITLYILKWIIDFFTEPFMGIVHLILTPYIENGVIAPEYHKMLITATSRLAILLFLFLFILILGILCQKITKRITLTLFSRIPFITTLYRMTKEITKALIKPGKKTFKETVMVPFPHPDNYSLGLVTGSVPPLIQAQKPHLDLTVFVPTAPHPFSGYLVMTSRKEALSVDISTEELFQFLISAGMTTGKSQ